MGLMVSDQQIEEGKDFLRETVGVGAVGFPVDPAAGLNELELEKLNKVARIVGERFTQLGFAVKYYPTEGIGPYVVGTRIEDPSLPTILFYNHYDVQPVDLESWNTHPFTLTEMNGRLYGRGASDDQGGLVAVWVAMKAHLAVTGKFGFNVIWLAEGDEECGITDIGDFCRKNKEDIKADALIVMDGMNINAETGTLIVSTRGTVMFDVTVEVTSQPQHSGMFGLVPDPILQLSTMISDALRDPYEIEGLMDGASQYTEEQLTVLKESSITAEKFKEDAGMLPGVRLLGDPNKTIFERIAQDPMVTVINMVSGERGGSGAIQNKAACTIQTRIVAGQDPEQVGRAIKRQLERTLNLHNCVVEIKQNGMPAKGWKGRTDGPILAMYEAAMGENFPQIARAPTGGCIPLMPEYEELFPNAEAFIPGVEAPGTNAHSHNESQDIGLWRAKMNTLLTFFKKMGNSGKV